MTLQRCLKAKDAPTEVCQPFLPLVLFLQLGILVGTFSTNRAVWNDMVVNSCAIKFNRISSRLENPASLPSFSPAGNETQIHGQICMSREENEETSGTQNNFSLRLSSVVASFAFTLRQRGWFMVRISFKLAGKQHFLAFTYKIEQNKGS